MARPTVDGFLEGLPSDQVSIARAVQALIREAAPGASGSIKWSQLVFDSDGPFAALRGHGSHVTITFWRGAELAATHPILQGSGDRMRHVRAMTSLDLRADAFKSLVADAVDLNRRYGDPTRRR